MIQEMKSQRKELEALRGPCYEEGAKKVNPTWTPKNLPFLGFLVMISLYNISP